MTVPAYVRETRKAYDRMAAVYAERFGDVDNMHPLERAFVNAFAEMVRGGVLGPLADLGCGPGHITGHLDSSGLAVFGVDLSRALLTIARRVHPHLAFYEGSIAATGLRERSPAS